MQKPKQRLSERVNSAYAMHIAHYKLDFAPRARHEGWYPWSLRENDYEKKSYKCDFE